MAKKIGFLLFGESETSFGFSLLFQTLEQSFEIETINVNPKCKAIPDVDFLMVSLICASDIFEYLMFCKKTGVKAECGIPVIIGGSVANPELLSGFYDYCVLGDGEVVIRDLFSVILGASDKEIEGVIDSRNYMDPNTYRANKFVPPLLHLDKRRISVPRIEIARGCKWKCPFCHIAAIKPYRELDKNVIINLCKQVKGRQVGLFAPDRADHSGFPEIVEALRKMGKQDTASDMRLDSASRHDVFSSHIRFGFEGFSDLSRVAHRKCGGVENVKKHFDHLLNVVTNKKNKNIGKLDMYMILDLPTERDFDPFPEFAKLMTEIFENIDRRFTLFLIANSFCPMPFTKYEDEAIDIYSCHGAKFKSLNILNSNDNFRLALRGGLVSPVKRIMHNIAIRGDQRLQKIAIAMATNMKSHMNSRDPIVVSRLRSAIEQAGWAFDDVLGGTGYEYWFKKHSIENIRG